MLAEVGFPLRGFGGAMAEATWWLMVVGVAGVVVTTLGFKFGGSWVFLYPLPFHGAGQWGRLDDAFFFSGSVLLVGALDRHLVPLDPRTPCSGPRLHAVKSGIPNRLGVALGFGYVAPKRFATNPRPVPYAVIPLTVIAIDMIIATLPLAVLLVEMIVQSLSPSVTVDPLLAKNVLWLFGHPVVYLLLFPAVAIYYLLVPRFAGRPLVAGNVIADRLGDRGHRERDRLGAPHLHRLPVGLAAGGDQHGDAAADVLGDDRRRRSRSTASFFTIYRSRFQWNAASTALFLGLVGWLLAGLSGVINATIAFDEVVHNTLWIVGHFHQMALLNIGLVDLRRRSTRSCRSSSASRCTARRWRAGTSGSRSCSRPRTRRSGSGRGCTARRGASRCCRTATTTSTRPACRSRSCSPSRRSCSRQHRPDAPRQGRRPGARARTRRGSCRSASPARSRRPRSAGRSRGPLGEVRARRPRSRRRPPAGPRHAAGKSVFASAGCGGCHTLADAGTTGTVGPNLDEMKPSAEQVSAIVTSGKGLMPPYSGSLTPQQISDVADYVSQAAG